MTVFTFKPIWFELWIKRRLCENRCKTWVSTYWV